jgi:hypothetical protein
MPLFQHSIINRYLAGLSKPALDEAPTLISSKMQHWYEKSYRDFVKELQKEKVKLTLAQEGEWEPYFLAEAAKAQELKRAIDATDREIDRMVYEQYGLTEEEIAVVEGRSAPDIVKPDVH